MRRLASLRRGVTLDVTASSGDRATMFGKAARLSAEGSLYTCLFATGGHDLRALLRDGADDEALVAVLAGVWRARSDRYSEIRSEATAGWQKVEMSYIGG